MFTTEMTIHQAAAFFAPRGRHRNRPLACIALDDPAYLIRQAEAPDRECPPGSAFHEAVKVVAKQIIANYEADILAGRVLAPDEFTRSDWCNDAVFGTAGSEARIAIHRKEGRHLEEPDDSQRSLFGEVLR